MNGGGEDVCGVYCDGNIFIMQPNIIFALI
jgi:hypothetical protein